MKKTKFLLPFLLIFIPLKSQEISLVTTLETTLQESSGLIFLEGRLISHNDSGDEPVLYEIDTLTGNITRTVSVVNASHVDWEDIAYDDEYIYIGDFGNNSGSRQDLKIYKIGINDYLTASNDEVNAELIGFSYSDQSDFTPGENETNFDAEALIAMGDSLYIFSKRWLDNKSTIYSLPKEPGTHSATKLAVINTAGLITGASFNPDRNQIKLIGYSLIIPFTISLKNFTGSDIAGGDMERKTINMPTGISVQTEAIATINSNSYFFSSEQSLFGSPGLCRLVVDQITARDNNPADSSPLIQPNPPGEYFHILSDDFTMAEIYSSDGRLIRKVKQKTVMTKDMKAGSYFVVIKNRSNKMIKSAGLIIQE